MNNNLSGILDIICLAEKLKCELRHSYLSSGKQESVAEHSWRMSLIALMLEKYLSKSVNIERLLKTIIVHVLVEAEAGDIPSFDTMNNEEVKYLKRENEVKAIEKIRAILGDSLGADIYKLWYEFEDKETYEAKVANAIDKVEAQIQHNEGDINTWLDIEYKMCFMLDKHVDFDPVLIELKNLIQKKSEEKIISAGKNVDDCR